MRPAHIFIAVSLLLAACSESAVPPGTTAEEDFNASADITEVGADIGENALGDVPPPEGDSNGEGMNAAGLGEENITQRSRIDPGPPGGNTSATASDIQYCDIVQDRISVADCAYYREIWARLEPGRAALDAPQQMTRNRPETVSFALARPASDARPGAIVDPSELLDSAPEKSGTVRVGRHMAVRLDGEGFLIAPSGLVRKELGASGAARWDWQVTPQRQGRRRLTVSAYVIIGGSENLIRTLAQDVDVTVSRGDQAKDLADESQSWVERLNAWLLALAALIGGGAYAVWRAIRKFRQKDEAPGSTAAGGEPGGSDGPPPQ